MKLGERVAVCKRPYTGRPGTIVGFDARPMGNVDPRPYDFVVVLDGGGIIGADESELELLA